MARPRGEINADIATKIRVRIYPILARKKIFLVTYIQGRSRGITNTAFGMRSR
jgi:hypothetical protein